MNTSLRALRAGSVAVFTLLGASVLAIGCAAPDEAETEPESEVETSTDDFVTVEVDPAAVKAAVVRGLATGQGADADFTGGKVKMRVFTIDAKPGQLLKVWMTSSNGVQPRATLLDSEFRQEMFPKRQSADQPKTNAELVYRITTPGVRYLVVRDGAASTKGCCTRAKRTAWVGVTLKSYPWPAITSRLAGTYTGVRDPGSPTECPNGFLYKSITLELRPDGTCNLEAPGKNLDGECTYGSERGDMGYVPVAESRNEVYLSGPFRNNGQHGYFLFRVRETSTGPTLTAVSLHQSEHSACPAGGSYELTKTAP